MAVGVGVTVPCAQLGTQLSSPQVPLPMAPWLFQDDQLMPVTMFPPSPEK